MSEWEQLVRQGGHERSKDHLDKVLDELGPMPDPGSEPGKLSMWVGVSRKLPSIVAVRWSFLLDVISELFVPRIVAQQIYLRSSKASPSALLSELSACCRR